MSWLADYSSCKQLCQDVAELLNDRNTEVRDGGNVTHFNTLINKDLLNLKAMTEKLKLDLIKSAKSRSASLKRFKSQSPLFGSQSGTSDRRSQNICCCTIHNSIKPVFTTVARNVKRHQLFVAPHRAYLLEDKAEWLFCPPLSKSVARSLVLDALYSGHMYCFRYIRTHGEIERRQNLLDTLTTRVRILNDAAESRAGVRSVHQSERDALLSTGGGDSTYVNPWFVSEDQAANLTTDEFRRMQEEVIKEQDAGLDALAEALNRQKNIGLSIGTEAANQSELIDDITVRMTSTESRIQKQSDGIARISKKSSTCVLWTVIICLGIAIIVIACIPKSK